jgi:hypothetical protein
MLRFANDVIWLKEWISQDPGNFGPLGTFDIQSWQNILAYVNSTGGLKHWLLDGKAAGGGVVVSLAVHQLDLPGSLQRAAALINAGAIDLA